MNKTETSQLLALIRLIDNRPITPEVVVVWNELLGGIGYEEAVAAMKAYYRQSSKWLMPAHLIELVEAARADADREAGRRKRELMDWCETNGIDWVRYSAGDPDEVAKADRVKHQAVEP